MTQTIVIRVLCTDESDVDWLRNKTVPAVESVVEDQIEEERLDGDVHVEWEIENFA